MSTPETALKNKLARRDDKISKLGDIHYDRLTFGPFSKVGTPDRLVHFGTVGVYVEVKAPGKKPTKLQLHRIEQCSAKGTPAFWCDDPDTYLQGLYSVTDPDEVEARLAQYREDAAKLRHTLEGLL